MAVLYPENYCLQVTDRNYYGIICRFTVFCLYKKYKQVIYHLVEVFCRLSYNQYASVMNSEAVALLCVYHCVLLDN